MGNLLELKKERVFINIIYILKLTKNKKNKIAFLRIFQLQSTNGEKNTGQLTGSLQTKLSKQSNNFYQ